MAESMIYPGSSLTPVYVTGKGPSYDTNYLNYKISPIPRGFLISVDGVLDCILASGEHRMFPSGTFATGVIIPLQIQELKGNNTACVYVATDGKITFTAH